MKERGMIFNAEMVRAILDGRKMQTRRIMKPQPTPCPRGGYWWPSNKHLAMLHVEEALQNSEGIWEGIVGDACPFGAIGDRLWVRETFAALERGSYEQVKPQQGYCHDLRYSATDRLANSSIDIRGYKWVPSIHMPRWASRITLEITGVRVERLSDISHEDAGREGIHTEVWDQTVVARNYATEDEFFQFWDESIPHYVNMDELHRSSFQSLWKSIYGEESWQANPWVWVVEFKRVEGGAE